MIIKGRLIENASISFFKYFMLLILFSTSINFSFGQTKVSATTQTNGKNSAVMVSGLSDGNYTATTNSSIANVDNPGNAVNGSSSSFATMTAKNLSIALVSYTGESWLDMKYSNTINSNTTTFVKIDKPTASGLNIDLLDAVGGLLGLLDENIIIVEAYNDSNIINNVESTIVEDVNGNVYLKVTPNQNYTSVRLKLRSQSNLLGISLGAGLSLNVYEAFYYNGVNSCGRPFATGVDAVGLNVDLLGGLFTSLGTNEYSQSIDGDADSYSILKAGNLLNVNVGSYISQNFYFSTVSVPQTTFNIKLGANTGLLDLGLLTGLEVNAYRGNTLVYSRSLKGGLLNGVEVLGLIGGGSPGVLTFAPGKAFDKIEVRLNTGVNIGLASGGLRIYDVQRYDGSTCINPNIVVPTPTTTPFEVTSCATSLIAFDNVDFAYNTIDGNNESYATLYADDGTLLSAGQKNGMIQMAYTSTVPANTTSYIRIDMEKEVLEKLLGGTLGQVIDGALGLVIGKHYFEVEAFSGNTSVTKSVSNNGFANTNGGAVTLVQDNIGRFYIAVTPNAAYNSVKITNISTSLLSTGKPAMLKVYNMCHETGTNTCLAPQFTSYNQVGLNLSVANLNGAGVINPYYAISNNSSEFSEISVGTVGVAAMVNQVIYFSQPSITGDELKVRLQFSPNSLLAADVLGRYRIVTFLGEEQKESFTLQQGLINNLDLLTIFQSGGIQTLSFPTTEVFDRVEIQVGTILSVGITPPVRLYSVKRISSICLDVSAVSPFISPVCATKLLAASNVNDVENLFDDNFDSYATLESGAGFLLGLNQHEGFVEMGYDNPVPANTTSYVRIDFEGSELNKLVSGSLGNLVSGLLDGLVFGNHYFTVDVKDASGASILERGTQNTTSTYNAGSIRVVVDKLGRTYLAITPTQAYQSVRITDHTNSVLGLLASPNTMNVYGMCYETTTNNCTDAFVTSYEYIGVNLSVNALGGAGVTYPERAIDDNSTHGSEMTLGTVAVGTSVRQWIDFTTLSDPNSITNIKLKVGAGGITVPLLENLTIAAYNGETLVQRLDWNNGLIQGVDVLTLLNTNQIVDVPFQVDGQYNRIAIEIKNVLNVGVFPPVEIFSVKRMCKPAGSDQSLVLWKSYKIDGDENLTSVYGGEQVEYTIHVKNISNSPVSNTVITDRIPTGMTFQSSSIGQFANGEVTFATQGSIAPGEVQIYSFIVDVDSNLQGIIEIKNIAFYKVGGGPSYPSYPPLNNINPINPDVSKQPGTIIKVGTTLPLLPKAVISSDQNSSLCPNTEFTLNTDILNADSFQWYFNGEVIDNSFITNGGNTNVNFGKESTLTTTTPGSYTVVYTIGSSIAEVSDAFIVTELPAPVITIQGNQNILTIVDNSITLPTAVSPGATITWYDYNGTAITDLMVSFTTPGVYTYTVVAIKDGCMSYKNIIVTVYDSSLCPPKIERVYATENSTWGSIITGGVSDVLNTIDKDPKTYSTIITGVGLLGIGTTWQNVMFEDEVLAGTPVTIKLGKEYSGLVLGGGITVQGLDSTGSIIGVAQAVQGGLLDLLASDNVIEFTFVPSTITGPKNYKGVRITLGALASVAQLAKVYGVYYEKQVNNYSINYCAPVSVNVQPSILDVLHGVEDIGLGVASATASVSNPWNAVDGDLTTYAMMSRGVAVANRASLTVVFKQQAMPGDELQIVVENPGNPILSLELIKGYTIQRYLGEDKVGPEIDGTNGADVLGLKLLGLGYNNKFKIIVKETDKPFDRVKIAYGSVVGVLGEFTKIYEVSVLPKINVGVEDITSDIIGICNGGLFIIEKDITQICDDYRVYKEEVGGIPLVEKSTNAYEVPKDLQIYGDDIDSQGTLGPKYSVLYVQVYRNGCEVGTRIPVRIDLKNCGIKSNLNITHKIK